MSPTRLTDLRREFDDLLIASDHANRNNSLAAVPFAWEERPGVPKAVATLLQDDFSFDVSCHVDTSSTSIPAEDLFRGGVIRTVDPSHSQVADSMYTEGVDRHPVRLSHNPLVVEKERGRERGVSSSRLPSSRSRRTRSLPPPGVLDQPRQRMAPPSPDPVPLTDNGSRKWSFMDLFLFRSASDGRAMDADPLKKYSAIFRKHDQDVRNSGSMSKRRGRLSAHELHYNVNRAVSNDMKKKTYLPYKHGLLGRFSFNP